ncbi:MAG: NifU family protein [Actinobacteria bacterium]|nr:NifU family protein [Actinomycetota bacterium]
MSAADPAAAGMAEELVGLLMRMYGGGLGRIVELLEPDQVRKLAKDQVVAGLFVLHDLHPDDVDQRILTALDDVRPYLGSHGGGMEYLGIDDDGIVMLRLQGSCDGCPASTVTVKQAVETAILKVAPEVVRVEVEGIEHALTSGLLQINPYSPAAT